MSILTCISFILFAIAVIFTVYFIRAHNDRSCVFDGKTYTFRKPFKNIKEAKRLAKRAKERFIRQQIYKLAPSSDGGSKICMMLRKYDPEFDRALDHILEREIEEYKNSEEYKRTHYSNRRN